MSKRIEEKVKEVAVPEGKYAAVWSPDGYWGRGETSVVAWKNASKPKRFVLYVLPSDVEIKTVDFNGFGIKFPDTESGAERAAAFDWNEAKALRIGQ